jgi:hypothetical protein
VRGGFGATAAVISTADLVPAVVANSATAFLILLAMTVGLILPRMLFERFATARSAA